MRDWYATKNPLATPSNGPIVFLYFTYAVFVFSLSCYNAICKTHLTYILFYFYIVCVNARVQMDNKSLTVARLSVKSFS